MGPFRSIYVRYKNRGLLKMSGSGKSVVITGAASGVAKATSLMFLRREWQVFALDVNETGLQSLVTLAEESKLKTSLLQIFVCDLNDPAKITEVCATISEKLDLLPNGLNALVNCAALSFMSPVLGLPLNQLQLQLNVNTVAPILLTKAFLPLLAKGVGGNIVNVSSIGGIRAWPFQGVYSVSKYGLQGFTDALRKELLSAKLNKKVKVCTINPGGIDTPMGDFIINSGNKWLENNKESPFYTSVSKSLDTQKKAGTNQKLMKYKKWFLVSGETVGEKIICAATDKNPEHKYFVMAPLFGVLWFFIYCMPTSISDKISANL